MSTEASPEVARLDDRTVAPLVPHRDGRSHKGSHGTLIIVAGSIDHLGAALLATEAAVRAGSGLVCLALPASLQPLAAGRVPEAVTMGLPERVLWEVEPRAAAQAILGRSPDALLLGPGLRPGEATAALVMALLREDGAPAVVDAEALNVLAAAGEWWTAVVRRAVLTPHPGEFARLDGSPVGPADHERAARVDAAARRWGRVVVLKGAGTVIAAGDGRVARAPFENPALASAGTGDVLAGTMAALLAQGLEPWDAARLGVYLHGVAAERASERLGDAGLMASDLPLLIARARHDLGRATGGGRGDRRLGFGERSRSA
ncbi:MAG: NAD(P)H-hydrate dehydratase [Chloroflexota bacterium]|nr:NAD(P)H-hydrate dehydratase [Chloroflexota bacterium]